MGEDKPAICLQNSFAAQTITPDFDDHFAQRNLLHCLSRSLVVLHHRTLCVDAVSGRHVPSPVRDLHGRGSSGRY